jgi:hypothetical protein
MRGVRKYYWKQETETWSKQNGFENRKCATAVTGRLPSDSYAFELRIGPVTKADLKKCSCSTWLSEIRTSSYQSSNPPRIRLVFGVTAHPQRPPDVHFSKAPLQQLVRCIAHYIPRSLWARVHCVVHMGLSDGLPVTHLVPVYITPVSQPEVYQNEGQYKVQTSRLFLSFRPTISWKWAWQLCVIERPRSRRLWLTRYTPTVAYMEDRKRETSAVLLLRNVRGKRLPNTLFKGLC